MLDVNNVSCRWRQRDLMSWKVSEIGRLTGHWGVHPCGLVSRLPSEAVAGLEPRRVAVPRRAKGLPGLAV